MKRRLLPEVLIDEFLLMHGSRIFDKVLGNSFPRSSLLSRGDRNAALSEPYETLEDFNTSVHGLIVRWSSGSHSHAVADFRH